MKKLLAALLVLLLPFNAFAALSANTVFELRTTGSDSNGGGFVAGASGTDYSQQASAQFSGTNLASTSGTTNPCIVTSATHNFASTDVGNLINVSAGTNWTTGLYQIVSVASNAATLDRACGSAATLSSGTWAEGGALLTPQKMLTNLNVTGQQAYVQAGTYSISTTLTTSSGISTNLGFARIIGYNTTRGDLTPPTSLTRPVWQLSAATTMLTDSNGGFRFENLTFDGNSKAAQGPTITGSYTTFFNDRIINFDPTSNQTFQAGGTGITIADSEFTNNGGNQSVIYANGSTNIVSSYIHDNPSTAFFGVIQLNAYNFTMEDSIVANNSGTTGLVNNFVMGQIRHCVFYNNAGDGIKNTGNYYPYGEVSNNIFVSNSGYGLNMGILSPAIAEVLQHHNAYYNNTSGARNVALAGTGDVTLTANPFTNAASNDFSLNNTSGGGALLRQVGFPGQLINGGTGYNDIGALRHRDPTLGAVYDQ